MKKTKIISFISVLFLVLILTACSSEQEEEEPEKQTEVTTAKELIERDESLLCYSQQQEEDAIISSTHYFDNQNERMRTDSEIELLSEDKIINSSYIVEDNWAYSWGNLSLMDVEGVKFQLDESQQQEEQDELDLEEELEFTCQSWQVDDSTFDLPEDVEFMDMTEFLNQMKSLQTPEIGEEQIESMIEDQGGLENQEDIESMIEEQTSFENQEEVQSRVEEEMEDFDLDSLMQ